VVTLYTREGKLVSNAKKPKLNRAAKVTNAEQYAATWEADLWNRKGKMKRMRAVIRDINPNGECIGAFPLYYDEPFEEVLKKYFSVFTKEAIEFKTQMKLEKSNTQNKGMTKQMRKVASFPPSLGALLKMFYPEYLEKQNYHKLRELIPTCFI